MALDLRSSELEQAFIKERISCVEKHFSDLSSKLCLYNKKLAHVRDSGDNLAKSILSFASKENLNTSLRNSLMHFADLLIAVQEYRDAQIQRIDVKVVLEFANYNPICKRIKTDLTTCFEIRKKEIKKKNQLEKARGKSSTNWQAIAQAERDYSQAKKEATQTVTDLSKKIDNFERQKIEDIKHVFLELIKIELVFHAKAIELYTTAYNTIKNIKIDEDLKEFQSHFRSYSSPIMHTDNSTVESPDMVNPSTSQHADIQIEQNQTTDDAGNSTNSSLKSYIDSKTSKHTPNSSIISPLTKQSQKLTKNDPTNKHLASCSSVGSSVRSKFDFGDHCL